MEYIFLVPQAYKLESVRTRVSTYSQDSRDPSTKTLDKRQVRLKFSSSVLLSRRPSRLKSKLDYG